MLAHRMEFDIANDDHRVVLFRKELLEMNRGILPEPLKELFVHSRDARGRLHEPFAVRILADGEQDFADGAFDAGFVDGKAGRGRSA